MCVCITRMYVPTPRLISAGNSLAPTVRTQKGKLMIEDCNISGGKIGITADNGCQMDIKRSVLQSYLFTQTSFLPIRLAGTNTHTHARTRSAPPQSFFVMCVYKWHPRTCALENYLHFSWQTRIRHSLCCLRYFVNLQVDNPL